MKLHNPKKTKIQQKKDYENVSERDCFLTPRYATNLLLPYLRMGG